MTRPAPRWVEVSRSQYPHEADGLAIVRSLLPDETPFHAWAGFEFRDGYGKWHEVDLVVLGHRRLHLVELKYYSGVLRGDDLTWLRDGHRAEDSPLKLARRKAQRLAGKLVEELVRWAQERGTRVASPRSVVPFVQEAVFLHHPSVRCELPPASRMDLFGLDGAAESGLPGISGRLLEPASRQQDVGPNREDIVVTLMERIGARQRRPRAIGSWVIEEEPIEEGDGWQDWPASHRVVTSKRARIRFLVTRPGAAAATEAVVRRIAEHEYQIMSRLAHDRLLCPQDMVHDDLGVGLVYPHDDRFQRLDLWLADQAGGVPAADRLALLREVAEAVAYAHDNRIVHRGLTPHAVLVCPMPGNRMRVLVGNWQSAGTLAGAALTGLPSSGVTGLMGMSHGAVPDAPDEEGRPRYQGVSPGAGDIDRRWAEGFQAPEGIWSPDSDRIRLDVFALGALAYFLLCGHPAAPDMAALRERLRREGGLDLAADLPQAPPAVRTLVLDATRSTVSERLPDVRSLLELLSAAEKSLAGRPGNVIDPLEASPGSVIDGRFRLERRLGAGSTAVGLLVTDLGVPDPVPDGSAQGGHRVLKIAIDNAAALRLADEARVLRELNDPRLVRLVAGPVDIGSRPALILETAGEETLGEVLHRRTRLAPDLLQRWGGDLLEALVALDHAGVVHRDIKPANLGVRDDPGDRVQHLVLFDFSMTRTDPGAVTAGTPPYLDPFLDSPARGSYDTAAERYSAAVVLFEMATGTIPRFGDGLSDPASVQDEAAIEAWRFDADPADALAAFFRTALARDARQRHASAAAMLSAWRAVFAAQAGAEAGAHPAADADDARPSSQTPADEAIRLLAEAEQIARAIDPGPRHGNFVREEVLAAIARAVGPIDPDRAEHLARGLTADRATALAHLARVLADTDPGRAARLLGDAQYHVNHSSQYFQWPFPELRLVRRQIIRAVGNRLTLIAVTGAVARTDPVTATRLLDAAQQVALLDEDLRDELLAGIAAATAVLNTARAEQIADRIEATERRAEALGLIASALASMDPPRGERIARSLAGERTGPPHAGTWWAAQALATIAAAIPPAETGRRLQLMAEAEQLARDAGNELALAEVATAGAETDRSRALRLLAEAGQLARLRPGHESLASVVTAAARIDPVSAEAIVRATVEPGSRAVALAQIAVAVTRSDPARAAQLVSEAEQTARAVPDDLVRQPEALARVAEAAAVADPARAELMAHSFRDWPAGFEEHGQSLTARTLVSIAEIWLAPQELQEWSHPDR